MDKYIKKVLNRIEKKGFEAYIVGGYVRDALLGKHSYDIDICTNALPKDLKTLFPNGILGNYGTLSFKEKRLDFEITTYRNEIGYENRRPKEIVYINNLIEDLNRRDFLINTICMNQKGHIIDLMKGYQDIEERIIHMVGDPVIKFTEDPLRMLRAIRFATILDFDLASEVKEAILKCQQYLKNLSKERIKDELDKIFIHDNCLKGIDMLDEFQIFATININHGLIVKIPDLMGMWSQFEIEGDFPFTKEEKNNIIKIKEIVKGKRIDEKVLFLNDLYLSMVAGEILGMDKIYINKLYRKLPIYSVKDICVSTKDIMKYLNIEQGTFLGEIVSDITDKILLGEIKNDRKNVYNYLRKVKELQL